MTTTGKRGRLVPEQAGAIPWRLGRHGLEILMITSSDGDRWIVPKGSIERGSNPSRCAVQEAYEEAGVRGKLSSGDPFGTVRLKRRRRRIDVAVFLLEVSEVHQHWPERDRRRRAWLTPAQAAAAVEDDGLRDLITELADRSDRYARVRNRG